MNRHERTLLLIASALVVSMGALRISHHISANVAQTLLLLGALFATAGMKSYNKRLKAENDALRVRLEQDDSVRR